MPAACSRNSSISSRLCAEARSNATRENGWPSGGAALSVTSSRQPGGSHRTKEPSRNHARKSGLYEHFALLPHTPGPSGDLNQALRQTFAAAKVGAEQALVCVDHADQSQLRKVMAFGQHLRANQNSRLAADGGSERPVHRALEPGRVAVDPGNRKLRKVRVAHPRCALLLTQRHHGSAALRAALVPGPAPQ